MVGKEVTQQRRAAKDGGGKGKYGRTPQQRETDVAAICDCCPEKHACARATERQELETKHATRPLLREPPLGPLTHGTWVVPAVVGVHRVATLAARVVRAARCSQEEAAARELRQRSSTPCVSATKHTAGRRTSVSFL